MKNKSKINGDGNFVFQKNENKPNKQKYVIAGLIVAVITLVATLIIGWDNIILFFSK